MRSPWMQTTREVLLCGPDGDVTHPEGTPVLLVDTTANGEQRIIEFPGGRTCHVEVRAVRPWPRS